MAARLTKLRTERARLAGVLQDYEKHGGRTHSAGDDLDDPENDITEERKSTVRSAIERMDREIAEFEARG